MCLCYSCRSVSSTTGCSQQDEPIRSGVWLWLRPPTVGRDDVTHSGNQCRCVFSEGEAKPGAEEFVGFLVCWQFSFFFPTWLMFLFNEDEKWRRSLKTRPVKSVKDSSNGQHGQETLVDQTSSPVSPVFIYVAAAVPLTVLMVDSWSWSCWCFTSCCGSGSGSGSVGQWCRGVVVWSVEVHWCCWTWSCARCCCYLFPFWDKYWIPFFAPLDLVVTFVCLFIFKSLSLYLFPVDVCLCWAVFVLLRKPGQIKKQTDTSL